MRLRKLEVYGFKSFATRTEIVFNEGITGIVGPNGSGKSNIGDAVRWVLGEQSAKTLRGTSMQDVIFGGTQTRKPLSYCEVSLTFDNEDGALDSEFAEVTVTRRVYRNGDSEYFLNRSACRLKDIVDLFRDTGIGKEGYSIIGQGRIDDILSRKDESRRQVFEEAAGIVKFKARKEDADKKLEKTRENLSRVDDILGELKRQLSPLEDQAKTARLYLELAAELKELDMNLFLNRSDKMGQKLKELDRELQDISTVLENTEATLQEKSESRDARQEEISVLDEKIAGSRDSLMTVIEAVHEARNNVLALKSRREARGETRNRLIEETKAQQERLAEMEQALKESTEGTEQQAAEVVEAEARLNAARAEEEKAREEEQKREEALEEQKNRVMEAMNRAISARNDQTRLKTMRQNMENRTVEVRAALEKLKAERENLQTGENDAAKRLENEKTELTRLGAEMEQIRLALEKADRDLIETRKQYDARLAAARETEGRQKLLVEMSRGMEGYSQPVREAMNHAEQTGMDGVYGVLGKLLTVPKEYETALDMVLGNAQQDIVTADEESAKTLIRYLREKKLGRATFLPVATVKGKTADAQERKLLEMPGCIGIASELVEFDEQFRGVVESLLGRTLIADTLEHGTEIERKCGYSIRLVTLKGDVLQPGGSMTGGSTGPQTANLFARERILKEMTETLRAQQAELETLLTAMSDGQKKKDDLKKQSAEALEKVHQQEIAVARETEHYENAMAEAGGLAARVKETEEALAQMAEGILEIDNQLEAINAAGEKDENERGEMTRKTEEMQERLAEIRRERTARGDAVMARTIELSEKKHLLDTARRDRTHFEEDKKRLAREQTARDNSLKELDRQDAEDAAKEGLLNEEAEKRAREQKQCEDVAHALEEKRKEKQDSLKALLKDMEDLHKSHDRDAEKYHRVELNRSRAEGELKTLQDRIWDTYGVTYAGAEEFRREGPFNMTEADRRAAQISTEIRAMGVVNVNAVEEYAETKQRFDALQVQREDLKKAEKDLTELIRQLLEQMTTQFTENFGKLQGYFSETFTRLFGGGHAELRLTDPSDPLNCGIEINAQPPGKKLQLLSLLSGGERTLTAIAILFATLKLKPSPFCILDEIEAALDDANIGYFADYLKEYGRDTQFVVVTHRKGTMERCDTLYGVSMEEQGVSRMVSVALKDWPEG